MKIQIELTEPQVKGIKDYIKSLGDVKNVNKPDIKREVNEILNGYFQSKQSALTDYIQRHENNQR